MLQMPKVCLPPPPRFIVPVDSLGSIKRQATYKAGAVVTFCTAFHEPGSVGLQVRALDLLPMATINDGAAPALMLRLAGGLSVWLLYSPADPPTGRNSRMQASDVMDRDHVADVSPPAHTR